MCIMLIEHHISIQRKEHPPGWFDFNDSFHIQLCNNRKRKTRRKEPKVSSSLAAIKAIIILQKCLLKLPFSVGLTNLSDIMTGEKKCKSYKNRSFQFASSPQRASPSSIACFPWAAFPAPFYHKSISVVIGSDLLSDGTSCCFKNQ